MTAREKGSLTATVYADLKERLVSCQIVPGARIRINELSTELNVSLAAVREALSRLMSEEMVVGEPQKGFRAAPISAQELEDLTNVRVNIEEECLRRSMQNGNMVWEARVLEARDKLAGIPVEPMKEWSFSHADFHEALVSACDSKILLSLRKQLYHQSERYRRLAFAVARDEFQPATNEHDEIVEAVLGRQMEVAADLSREHIRAVTRRLLAATIDGQRLVPIA